MKYIFKKSYLDVSEYFQPKHIDEGCFFTKDNDGMYKLHNKDGSVDGCRYGQEYIDKWTTNGIIEVYKEEKINSREIKFRVLAETDTSLKMVYLSNLSFYDDLVSFETDEHINNYATKELMQFSGLKDCCDKDIYEGDILECVYEDGRVRKVVCCFEEGSFVFKVQGSMVVISYSRKIELKVLGDIYLTNET